MKALILIPARLGSTRLPNKPLALMAGKPMIVHVWERACRAGLGAVAVACDGEEIAGVITKAGGRAVLTEANLPSGSDRIYQALQRLDPAGVYDTIINLQGDMPTFDPTLISRVLEPLQNPEHDIATLAAEITNAAERDDPAVVKVALAGIHTPQSTRALYFSRACIPAGEGAHYHHIGIYAYRRAALQRFVSLPPSPLELREKLEQLRALEAGMQIGVALVHTMPLGVDTIDHLEKARSILET